MTAPRVLLSEAERREIVRAGWATLVAAFPHCFVARGGTPLPLMVSVKKEIRAVLPDLDAQTLDLTLQKYTGSIVYLTALREGEKRIGLDGMPNGRVTALEARIARNRIANLRERVHAEEIAREEGKHEAEPQWPERQACGAAAPQEGPARRASAPRGRADTAVHGAVAGRER